MRMADVTTARAGRVIRYETRMGLVKAKMKVACTRLEFTGHVTRRRVYRWGFLK